MATVNFIKYNKQSAGCLTRVSDYVKQEKKVLWGDCQLVSGVNCSPQFSVQEFLATRQMYRKESPVYFYHYTQSFHPDEDITGAAAHDLATEFAERAWPGCEVLVATHTDAEHIHSHFIVNAVRQDNGKMLRQGPTTLRHLRELSDELCMKYGYSVLPSQRQKKMDGLSTREYRSAAKGQSWKFRLMSTIENCMRHARSREEFIRLMESEGYKVRWEKGRKYITYATPEGQRCRDNKLHGDKFWKERMEREFRIREEILRGGIDGVESDDICTTHAEPSHGARVVTNVGSASSDREAAGADRGVDGGQSGPAQSAPGDGAAGGTGTGAESTMPDGGEARTGWEEERAALLQMAGLAAGLQSDRGGQMGGAGVDHRGGAAGDGERRGNGSRQYPQPAPLKPLRAGLYGLAAMGGLLDDESEDAEEKYRRIQAEQAAKNFGAVIGLAAGAAMALTQEQREDKEQQEHQPEQTMGGL